MAKRGRPKLPPGEAKETRFELRLTAEDKERFRAAAETRGVSIAAWMLEELRAAAGKPAKKLRAPRG